MKRALRDKWVAALRSGEYVQTYGRLRRLIEEVEDISVPGSSRARVCPAGYCCWGVLADVSGLGGWRGLGSYVIEEERPEEWGDQLEYESDLSDDWNYLLDRLDVDEGTHTYLVLRNDGTRSYEHNPTAEQWRFDVIADWIEANVPVEP